MPPLCKGRWLGFRGPGEAQRQRVHRGEEEQRSDCAFRPQGGNKGCGACDDEAEGLFPSGQYFRAASDYELLNSRAVRWKTTCGAAIPHPLRGSPLYTKGPLYRPLPLPLSITRTGAGAPDASLYTREVPPYMGGGGIDALH